jgi:CHAD domain-containing protein
MTNAQDTSVRLNHAIPLNQAAQPLAVQTPQMLQQMLGSMPDLALISALLQQVTATTPTASTMVQLAQQDGQHFKDEFTFRFTKED